MRVDTTSQQKAPPLKRYILSGSTSAAVINAPPTASKEPKDLIIKNIYFQNLIEYFNEF